MGAWLTSHGVTGVEAEGYDVGSNPNELAGAAGEGWHPDPTGRHQYRYHDGSSWTDHVADGGQRALDPFTTATIPEPAIASISETGPTGVGLNAQTWPTPGVAYAPPSRSRTSMSATWPPTDGSQTTPPGGVTWQEANRRCLSKYVDFSGRAARSEYWWFYLTYLGTVFVASIFSETLGGLAILGLFLPHLAVTVRRLHDTGKPGWWLLIGLIPLLGPIVLIVWLASAGDHQGNVYGPPMTV